MQWWRETRWTNRWYWQASSIANIDLVCTFKVGMLLNVDTSGSDMVRCTWIWIPIDRWSHVTIKVDCFRCWCRSHIICVDLRRRYWLHLRQMWMRQGRVMCRVHVRHRELRYSREWHGEVWDMILTTKYAQSWVRSEQRLRARHGVGAHLCVVCSELGKKE